MPLGGKFWMNLITVQLSFLCACCWIKTSSGQWEFLHLLSSGKEAFGVSLINCSQNYDNFTQDLIQLAKSKTRQMKTVYLRFGFCNTCDAILTYHFQHKHSVDI